MTKRVEARAPCRVDLAGGTLDIWPIGLLHPGARTVNVAIDVEVRVRVAPAADGAWRVEQGGARCEVAARRDLLASAGTALVGLVAEHFDLAPLHVELASASPRGAGLGASSALAVALIAAVERLSGLAPSGVQARVRLARDLEARLMGLPTGIQDHYPALLGGALEILHLPGGERAASVPADLEALGRSLVVVHSGASHLSAVNNFEIVSRRLRGDAETIALFDEVRAAAAEMGAALGRGDLARVGELMRADWRARRRLSPVVTSPGVERILELGAACGAWGGKVCGAGGGGCVALVVAPAARSELEERIAAAGYEVLRCRPTAAGLRITDAG